MQSIVPAEKEKLTPVLILHYWTIERLTQVDLFIYLSHNIYLIFDMEELANHWGDAAGDFQDIC